MKKSVYLVLGISFLIFISGCLSVVSDAGGYADEYLTEFDYVSAASPEDLCKEGFCKCFVCKNGTGWLWPKRSLVGGECMFVDDCNQEKYEDFSDPAGGSDYFSQTFLIGAGPSFADFGDANLYCHDSLNMAVHWLLGDERNGYDRPDVGRTICMLGLDIIPVYVLYSDSENIDVSRTREIAHSFGDAYTYTGNTLQGPVGPVIITTEFEYNATKPGVVDAVVDQIHAINEECNDIHADPPRINCFVAVAPRIGDTEALDAVMSRVDDNEVHMLAYGINSNYANRTRCNGQFMREDAARFSRYALYNYSIPTVIPYILFDSGSVSPDGCAMTDSGVADAYGSFFPNGVQHLMDAGVIGISLYDFNTSTFGGDPLGCVDCAVGSSNDRMNAWFGGCQKFVSISSDIPSGGMPIIFPNESGGYCDYGSQMDSIFHMWRDVEAGQDFSSTIEHEVEVPEREDALFRCDACLTQSNKSLFDYFPVLEEFAPDGFPTAHSELCPGCTEPATCYIYPQIDYYASKESIDPMLMRAIIWAESNFNTCSQTKICRVPGTDGCLNGKYSASYNEMHDPSGVCDEHLQSITAPDFNPSIAETDDQTPSWRFAGSGLTQVMEPPYTFWPAEYSPTGEDGEYWYEFQRREYDEITNPDGRRVNLEGASQCAEEFNPFNASHAICRGSQKMGGIIQRGRAWVDEIEHDYCTIAGDASEREILAAFYAIYAYTGVLVSGYDNEFECAYHDNMLDCYAEGYCELKQAQRICEARDPSDPHGCGSECTAVGGSCIVSSDFECRNANDYMAFSLCKMKLHGLVTEENQQIEVSSTAGFKKLAMYQYLKDNCPNNYCPPYERLVSDLGLDINDPERVNPDFDPNNPYSIYGEPEEGE